MLPVSEKIRNPFINGCGLDALNDTCLNIFINIYEPDFLPKYTLLFSLKKGLTSRIRKHKKFGFDKSDSDTVCDQTGKVDIFNDICVYLSMTMLVESDRVLFS